MITHWRDKRLAVAVMAIMLLLLAGCGGASRYVLVQDRSDVDFADGGQRFLCLTQDEAARVPGLVSLHKKREVRDYAERRGTVGDPLERVLYFLISGDYAAARARLEKDWQALPEGLRLLLKADISYETGTNVPAERLSEMYQEAYERQKCDLNRDLIRLRIRQLRYGR